MVFPLILARSAGGNIHGTKLGKISEEYLKNGNSSAGFLLHKFSLRTSTERKFPPPSFCRRSSVSMLIQTPSALHRTPDRAAPPPPSPLVYAPAPGRLGARRGSVRSVGGGGPSATARGATGHREASTLKNVDAFLGKGFIRVLFLEKKT